MSLGWGARFARLGWIIESLRLTQAAAVAPKSGNCDLAPLYQPACAVNGHCEHAWSASAVRMEIHIAILEYKQRARVQSSSDKVVKLNWKWAEPIPHLAKVSGNTCTKCVGLQTARTNQHHRLVIMGVHYYVLSTNVMQLKNPLFGTGEPSRPQKTKKM